MRIARIIAASLFALILLGGRLGAFMPRTHAASGSPRVRATPEHVCARPIDAGTCDPWRPDLRYVELAPLSDSRTSWPDSGKNGSVTYVTEETARPTRFVVRIADKTLPSEDTPTNEIAGAGQDTRLTITQRGEVYHSFIRVLARLFFSNGATIDPCCHSQTDGLPQPNARAALSSG